MSLAVKTCPICKSSRLLPGIDLFYWRNNKIHFSDCADCGLTFANPMPSDEMISNGNSALVRLYHQNKSFDQEFREARQAYLRGKVLAWQLKKIKKTGRFLELGCYQGFLSLGVKENCDWQVETLEITPALADFVQNNLGITCHKGTLENTNLQANSYDFILCHDLIEHINEPQVFLDKVIQLLKPGGKIQIITPNTIQDFAFNRRACAAGTPPTILLNHIMNFSPKALKFALESRGLKLNKFYCYGVKQVLKDFGCFGLGKPKDIAAGPSMQETLQLDSKSLLPYWNSAKVQQLKMHPKTSNLYAIWKEILPKIISLKVPARFGIGHEIYVLAEKAN